MQFTASIHVTAARPTSYDEPFFDEKIEVTAETVGAVYDKMVEATYLLSKAVSVFVDETHFKKDGTFKDYWYVSCTFPHVTRYPTEENLEGAGSALDNVASLLTSVVHYRHLAIRNFFNSTSKRMRNGYYAQYLDVNPQLEYLQILKEVDIAKYRNYGYTGVTLDTVITEMGQDYFFLLKDYEMHYDFTYKKRASTPLVKTSAPRKSIFDAVKRFIRFASKRV